MNETTTVGLDLAKNVFQLMGCIAHGKEANRKVLKRGKLVAFFASLPPCLIGMEACTGANYWGRWFKARGHEVCLILPRHVKAYVRGNKNDYNDARAIAEAARGPDIHFVPIEMVEQQDVQALDWLRAVRKRLPELLEEAYNGPSDFFRPLLADCYQ